MRIFDRLIGYYVLETEENNKVIVVNLMRNSGIEFTVLRKNNPGRFRFTILKKDRERLDSLLDKRAISVYIIHGKGIPFLLSRYRLRPGILVGAILFMLILSFSSRYIWDVTVSGNSTISDAVVLERLGELGFGIGLRSDSIDYDELCNSCLRLYDDISWITVNVKGTRAEILLRESSSYDKESDVSPSNLIAKYDGQIESMTVFSGKEVVESEQTVRAGDLLVTGVIDSSVLGMRLEKSVGTVWAYVNRTLTVSVPQSGSREVKTEEYSRKSIKFFGMSFPVISRDNKKDYSTAVRTSERLIIFDRIFLPVFIDTDTVYSAETSETFLTEEQAGEIAADRMSEMIAEEIDGAVLKRKSYTSIEDGVYTLRCDIYCICNIAEEVKIDVK